MTTSITLYLTAEANSLTAEANRTTIRQVDLSHQKQTEDRLARAVDQLGAEKLHIRLSGVYLLESLMDDSNEDAASAIQALCDFIRTHAPVSREPKEGDQEAADVTSSADILAAFRALNRRPNPENRTVRLDLHGIMLNGVVVEKAQLQGANLRGSKLVGAVLNGADLSDSALGGAELRNACLRGATLQRATLEGSDPNGTYADLTETDLSGANLNATRLGHAHLTAADLGGANLTGADLSRADWGDTYQAGADLSGADLTDALLPGGKTPKGPERTYNRCG